jgi:hypothetical protein
MKDTEITHLKEVLKEKEDTIKFSNTVLVNKK